MTRLDDLQRLAYEALESGASPDTLRRRIRRCIEEAEAQGLEATAHYWRELIGE